MIITVTMNPAIDKTVEIEAFVHGGLNRITNITTDAGGKGINVSKTIKALGGDSLATGFLSGNNGKTIQNALEGQDILNHFVFTNGETRVNTKIIEASGTVTELNEKGPVTTENDVDMLLERIHPYLQEGTIIVLSGSIPTGVQKNIYKTITEYAHRKNAKVFVDADGELFSEAMKARPDIIKPNKEELEEYLGMKLDDENMILAAGQAILTCGIKTVIISLGAKGAYFMSKEHTLYSPGLNVERHSTVGAGDAMVAALVYGMDKGHSLEECAKLAMATSAGAVMTIGTKPPTRAVVDALLEQVVVTKFV